MFAMAVEQQTDGCGDVLPVGPSGVQIAPAGAEPAGVVRHLARQVDLLGALRDGPAGLAGTVVRVAEQSDETPGEASGDEQNYCDRYDA
ncbi:hypothetical protein GCM10010260_20960 [Streptomyces filipinensis]|uniref:Uncharacterized protein n=1 Tax=Streptomyces filipinensis TaxID=66887 RepID=A0A918MAC9_9ACTN|nr:hypothetical protein GCM10010260_20960 [Streptomyces filipinensis]